MRDASSRTRSAASGGRPVALLHPQQLHQQVVAPDGQGYPRAVQRPRRQTALGGDH